MGKKKPLAKAAVIVPERLPFQMPTRLAVGLGLGSALSALEFAPKTWVPRTQPLGLSFGCIYLSKCNSGGQIVNSKL